MISVKFCLASLFIAPLRLASAEEPGAVVLLQVHAETQPNALSEHGYQILASQKNDEEMKTFIRQLLSREGRSVSDEAGLDEFVPFFSGSRGVQSFEALTAQLRSASWVDHGLGRTAPLSDEGLQSILAPSSELVGGGIQLKAFTERMLSRSAFEITDKELFSQAIQKLASDQRLQAAADIKLAEYKSGVISALVNMSIAKPRSGMTVMLNQEGYKLMADAQNDSEMEVFVQRLVAKEGRYIRDATGLRELLLPTELEDLKKQLRNATWVDPGMGRTVPLSEDGYKALLELKDDLQMKNFAVRILAESGHKAADENELAAVAAHGLTYDDYRQKVLLVAMAD